MYQVFGTHSVKSDRYSNCLVIGNGESRADIDLEQFRNSHMFIGCNAIYRDYDVDHLVACDRFMAAEVQLRIKNKNTIIYTREPWDQLQPLPKGGDPITWGSGTYAVQLAIELGFRNIVLIGFDLYSETDTVNNIYKGTPNYAATAPIDPSYWISHIGQIIQENPWVTFNLINSRLWTCPQEWKQSNVNVLTKEKFLV